MRYSRRILLCSLMAAAALLVPAAGTAQRTSVARDFPIYNNGGKPDIVYGPATLHGPNGDRRSLF